jgi:hypothetical protein
MSHTNSLSAYQRKHCEFLPLFFRVSMAVPSPFAPGYEPAKVLSGTTALVTVA